MDDTTTIIFGDGPGDIDVKGSTNGKAHDTAEGQAEAITNLAFGAVDHEFQYNIGGVTVDVVETVNSNVVINISIDFTA